MSRALDDATTVGIIIALFCVTEGCALALWNAVVRLTERRDTEDDGFWRPEQPNVRIVDWKHLSDDCQGDNLFYEDGIHLKPAGADCYAAFIKAAVS